MSRVLPAILGLSLAVGAGAAERLPPDAEGARAALEASSRQGEWVDIPYTVNTGLRSFVVYPQRPDSSPVVIVIHEIDGLTDWIRAVGDRLAAEGFITVAPDLLSGLGPGGGGTDSVGSRDDVVKLVRGLSPAETHARLDAVRRFAVQIPSANGRVATMGFGWGGSRSFGYATHQPSLDAAVVYYGGAPEDEAFVLVEAPVLGLYAGDDAQVNATIPLAMKRMRSSRRRYETEIYEGAAPGFMRSQGGRRGANKKAAEKAWPRTIKFLRKAMRDEEL